MGGRGGMLWHLAEMVEIGKLSLKGVKAPDDLGGEGKNHINLSLAHFGIGFDF